MKKTNIIINFFLFFLLSILFQNVIALSGHSVLTDKNVNASQFVDRVGKQRMLMYQILVAYAQIGQVQSYGNPVNIKQMAIDEFENSLQIIKSIPRFNITAQRMEIVWTDFKKTVLMTPDKYQLNKLIAQAEQIVSYCNSIIKSMVQSSSNNINIVNIAGKQRMLSQRIALFMLAENWGLKEGNYRLKLQQTLAEFAINLNTLKRNSDNTKKINQKIKSMEKDFSRLIRIIAKGKQERDYSFSISRNTSQILRKAKVCTRLYVELKNEVNVAMRKKGRSI